ncbi:hypothetical protein DIPPA_11652 [Diplonema papillatum]|nr:hypothetical protein DIPPA_11652 [Diplonema papillatum]
MATPTGKHLYGRREEGMASLEQPTTSECRSRSDRSDPMLSPGLSTASLAHAATTRKFDKEHDLDIPAFNRIRSSTGTTFGKKQAPPRQRQHSELSQKGIDRLNSSLSNSIKSVSDDERTDLLSDQLINLPMPKEDPLSTPSLSRCSSMRAKGRLGGRKLSKYSQASEMEEGIGEALQQLSESIALSRQTSSFAKGVRRPSASVFGVSARDNYSSRSADYREKESLSSINIPGVPVVTEDAVSVDNREYAHAGSVNRTDSCSQQTTSPASSACGDEGVDSLLFETGDPLELQKALKYRLRQLTEAVDMGQRLFQELAAVREDLNVSLDERDLLFAENDTLRLDAEEYRKANTKLIDQVKNLQSNITELHYVRETQAEELHVVKQEMQMEKKVMEQKEEDLKADAKWQEEKFVAVQQAVEKAKPSTDQMLAVKSLMFVSHVRSVYFNKLRQWGSDNRKKRNCINVISVAHSYREEADRCITTIYFERWTRWGSRSLAYKFKQRHVLKECETEARLKLVSEETAAVVTAVNDFAGMTLLGWQVTLEESEVDRMDFEARKKQFKEQAQVDDSERKWRSNLSELAWEGVVAVYSAAAQAFVDEWYSARSECRSKMAENRRVREQWSAESAELRASYGLKDSEVTSLSQQLKETHVRAAISENTVVLHEEQLAKIRADNVGLSSKNITLRQELDRTHAELCNCRSQLEYQHLRAKSRVFAMQNEAAITPCIKNAMNLVANLKQKAEDTRRLSDAFSLTPSRSGSLSPDGMGSPNGFPTHIPTPS